MMTPSEHPCVTLLTDFGLTDVYVGVMKGVMAQINPSLQVIDLTHQIPPQQVAVACFSLASAYAHFPPGTVHVAVVDPGVGGQRRAVAVEFPGGFLVGPDNGLFNGVLAQADAIAAVELTNPEYWHTPHPSSTFHGRDIFAPVGAHLASGVPLHQIGEEISVNSLIQADWATYVQTDVGLQGIIQHVDRFGNLITNIPARAIAAQSWSATVSQVTVASHSAYGNVAPGQPLALIGSHGWVEIAVNCGDAQFQFRAKLGDPVTVELDEPLTPSAS
jgi:hypothetical protein